MIDEAATLSVPEAGRIIGAGRCLSYRLVQEGKLPVLRLGRRKLRVPKAALEELLRNPSGAKAGVAG